MNPQSTEISAPVNEFDFDINSPALNRNVKITIFYPPQYYLFNQTCNLLFLNDGQDKDALGLKKSLETLHQTRAIIPTIVIAIHSADRKEEYGTATIMDYKQRGKKAKAYQDFLIKELVPFIKGNFNVYTSPKNIAVAGCSLGGLSAMETAWRNPEVFGNVGAFSGSFWWRTKALFDGYTDKDRIMHQIVHNTIGKPNIKFWIQVGTLDETMDRNKNGVIDAIDDALDLVLELEKKGYKKEADIRFVSVEGGEHNQDTWGSIFPDFMTWTFGS